MSMEESKIQNGPGGAGAGEDPVLRKAGPSRRSKRGYESKSYARPRRRAINLCAHARSQRIVADGSQLRANAKRRELTESAEANEFATYILDGAQRMEQLLSDLVVYSRQFRPLDQTPVAVDSEAVLEGVLLNLDGLIRKGQASVTYDPLPKVLCDSTQLSHLFRHLLVNGLTFRGAEPARIHMSAVEQGGQAEFSVRDNGLGIDPRFHDQIFAIFKRLHGRDYPGNGMGLAICKRIVEQNGGRIWVESAPDQGSTFHFTLPG